MEPREWTPKELEEFIAQPSDTDPLGRWGWFWARSNEGWPDDVFFVFWNRLRKAVMVAEEGVNTPISEMDNLIKYYGPLKSPWKEVPYG